MALRFDDVAEALQAAATAQAATALWQSTVEAMGFISFDYAFGRLTSPRPKSMLDFAFAHFSATRTWTDQYFVKKYYTVDRGSLMSITRMTPWTYDSVLDPRPMNALQREMHGEVRLSGVNSGLGVPLHGVGSAAGLMHLGCDLSSAEFARLDRETRPLAVLVSAYFHERMQVLLPAAPAFPETRKAPARPLSARERECLLWVAKGKTSWEISAILRLSEATVNNILAGARRKLQVATRAQAVAKAIASGEIVP